MKRLNVRDAALIVSRAKTTAGKMNYDDLRELLVLSKEKGIESAIVTAYNAGFYCGASATKCGKFDPETERKNLPRNISAINPIYEMAEHKIIQLPTMRKDGGKENE